MVPNNIPLAGLLGIVVVIAVIGAISGLALSGTDLLNFNSSAAEAHIRELEAQLQADRAAIDLQYYEAIQAARTELEKEELRLELEAQKRKLEQELAHQREVALARLQWQHIIIRGVTISLTSLLVIGASISVAVVIQRFLPRRDTKSLSEKGVVQAHAVARVEGFERGQPIEVGEKYTLAAGILQTLPEDFESVPFRLALNSTWPITFEISVQAEGMDIEPFWIQEFMYIPDRDTELVRFQLIPRITGRKEIRVEFYHRRHWLAQIRLEVEVIEAEKIVPVQ